MSYSVKAIFGNPDKNGQVKVYIQVIVNRRIIKLPTSIHVDKPKSNTDKPKLGGVKAEIVSHERMKIENKILELLRYGKEITKESILGENYEDVLFQTYIEELRLRLKGTLSHSRLKHYVVMRNLMDKFNPKIKLKDFSPKILDEFVAYLKSNGNSPNTIAAKIALLKSVINRAIVDKIVPTDIMLGYKNPKKVETIPVYLEKDELQRFENLIQMLGDGTTKKMVGMYFLLS